MNRDQLIKALYDSIGEACVSEPGLRMSKSTPMKYWESTSCQGWRLMPKNFPTVFVSP